MQWLMDVPFIIFVMSIGLSQLHYFCMLSVRLEVVPRHKLYYWHSLTFLWSYSECQLDFFILGLYLYSDASVLFLSWLPYAVVSVNKASKAPADVKNVLFRLCGCLTAVTWMAYSLVWTVCEGLNTVSTDAEIIILCYIGCVVKVRIWIYLVYAKICCWKGCAAWRIFIMF